MSIADCIIARSRAAAALVAESKTRLDVERAKAAAEQEIIENRADDLRDLLMETFINIPLRKAKIDPENATRAQQDKVGHGRIFDRAVRQLIAIAKDVEATKVVTNALKHAWEDRVGFVAAAGCFVTPEEARGLGYRW